MTEDDRSDEARATFEFLSNEYAQAVQAFKVIEEKASLIVAFGASDDLRVYIDQFIAMATGVREKAIAGSETNFVEWFDELIGKAEALRADLVRH